MAAFIIEQQVNHRGARNHPEFHRVELARFAQNFTQDVIGHGAGCFHRPFAVTSRTGLAQQMGQGFAGALAGHFHQAQLGKPTDHGFHPIALQMLAKLKQHRLLVLRRQHVDEIGHHNAAQIAQTQLARNGTRRFEVGFENGLIKVARTHIATGVDINRGQGLSLVDHQIAPRFQVHTPAQGAADLVIDRKQIKDGPLTLVQL